MASQSFSLSSRAQLSNGASMPLIQLGVYMMSGDEVESAVHTALDTGYRGFDSAEWYENERETGHAILSYLSSPSNTDRLTRDEIYFTSKLKDNISYAATRNSIKRSIQACGLGHIDMYLLHSPLGGKFKRLACWKAVEDAIKDGEVKFGGVSNFGVRHLQELLASDIKIKPAVNQIEVHPFNLNSDIVSFCQTNDIVIQAWGPLVRGMKMTHHQISSMARKYSCSPAQLLIRWSLQKGFITLPKSATPARIRENAQISDFEISDEDMAVLAKLDEGFVTDWDPTNVP